MPLGDQSDPVLAKQNDTRPIITATATQGNGNPVPLPTGTTIVFNMRANGGAVKVNRASASVVSQTGGSMQWTPATGNYDTNGLYQAEFEATFPDGGVQTFPPGEQYIWILVGDDVA